MRRLKSTETAKVKLVLLEQQDYICPICKRNLRGFDSKNIVLDHDHKTGIVRGVLCRNCNGCEGKVHTAATRGRGVLAHITWIENLVAYLKKALYTPPTYDGEVVQYSTHKTDDEKRLKRNAKARERYAKRKAQGK